MNPAASCTLCPLALGRRNVVWGEGPAGGIMLLGHKVGGTEDRTGRPFTGPTGQLLDRLVAEAGLERRGIYLSNVVKCRPPENRDPLPREIESCSSWLDLEVSTVKPRVVVLLGKQAAARLAGGIPAGAARATTLHGQSVIALATHHPAAALRDDSGRLAAMIVRDLRRAGKLAEEHYT